MTHYYEWQVIDGEAQKVEVPYETNLTSSGVHIVKCKKPVREKSTGYDWSKKVGSE